MYQIPKMLRSSGLGGWTAASDHSSGECWGKAKLSLWATPEQNHQLEQDLVEIVQRYVRAVAESNNGKY